MIDFKIGKITVGDDHEPAVIAEIGINHEGSLDTAIEMADAAIDAGAQIIKHQTHVVEDEMSEEAKSVVPSNADVSIYSIMQRCALSEDQEHRLMQHVKSRGRVFISTPFSRAAAERLARFDIPAYKIGSGECNNYPLVRFISKLGKPVILSTGMNSIETIRPSVEILRQARIPYALLHCTNVYPTPYNLVRLGAIPKLKQEFSDAVVGLSDHTISNHCCIGAVALGARILERHFTDRMDRPGPDIVCSMDPSALADLIVGSRNVFQARGSHKDKVDAEAPTIAFAFASVVVTVDLEAGDTLTEENLWLRRPGGGDFGANQFDLLVGNKLLLPISKGSRLTKAHIKSD
jgi:N-acetylneuraminate synthase